MRLRGPGFGIAVILAAGLAFVSARAHDGTAHDDGADITDGKAESEAIPALPFPVQIDGRFSLTDQYGVRRTNEEFRGQAMLIFFGYANCQSICSAALPNMAGALEIVDLPADVLQPIMITVDPDNDTITYLRERMPEIHPYFLGLTGDGDALAAAYRAFQVEAKELFQTPEGQPVYAHGSFIYLIGPDGTLLSVFPPILQPERMAELIERYI